MVADISSPRRFVFERPVGADWQYQPRKDRMTEKQASAPQILPGELSSQWFLTEPCCLATRVANWCSLPGAATGCSQLVPSARTTVLRSNRDSSSVIRCPLHHGCFRVRTGEALRARALEVLY